MSLSTSTLLVPADVGYFFPPFILPLPFLIWEQDNRRVSRHLISWVVGLLDFWWTGLSVLRRMRMRMDGVNAVRRWVVDGCAR